MLIWYPLPFPSPSGSQTTLMGKHQMMVACQTNCGKSNSPVLLWPLYFVNKRGCDTSPLFRPLLSFCIPAAAVAGGSCVLSTIKEHKPLSSLVTCANWAAVNQTDALVLQRGPFKGPRPRISMSVWILKCFKSWLFLHLQSPFPVPPYTHIHTHTKMHWWGKLSQTSYRSGSQNPLSQVARYPEGWVSVL